MTIYALVYFGVSVAISIMYGPQNPMVLPIIIAMGFATLILSLGELKL